MSCLLCLELIVGTADVMNIDSAEGKALDAHKILGQYFAEQLATADTAARSLCRQCWAAVFAFHQFYLRVQRAHHAVQVIKEEFIAPKYNVAEAEPPPTKWCRGRLRRRTASASESSNNAIELQPEGNAKTEEQQITCSGQRTQLEFVSIENIKHEALQEPPMDVGHLTTGCDVESTDAVAALEDRLAVGVNATRVKLKRQRKPIDERKSTRSFQDSDKFIAQHIKLDCCLCDSAHETFSALQEHFNQQHQTPGYIRCCGKKLLKRALLVDHIHVHLDPNYFQCSTCGRALASRDNLESHLKLHRDKTSRIYQCNVCSKSYFKQSTLKRHMAHHVPVEQRHFSCPQCDKTFARDLDLRCHVRSIHLKSYNKVCDICGKSVQGREVLKRHMEEHAGVKQPPVQCELCGLSSKSKYLLARHIKTMHMKEYQTPQTCTVCGKVSQSVRTHVYHMKYMHEMERKYACPICDKAFKLRTSLKDHMNTHTGEALYSCEYCPRTFKSGANMWHHRKKMHPKEWAENHAQKHKIQQNIIEES